MAGHPDNLHIMNKVFAPELRPDAALLAYLQYFRLPLQITESTAPLVAACRQRIVITGRSLLDRREVGLGGGAAYHDCQVVRRTGRRTEVLYLLPDELRQRFLVQQRLGLLIEKSLVGRTAAFGDEKELVLVARFGIDVYLGRQVVAAVLLFGHGERHHHRITQITVAVGLIHSLRDGFGIVRPCIDIFALLAYRYRRTGILTGRQLPLSGHDLIEQHRIGYEFVVVGRLRVFQYVGDLLQVRRTQIERHFGESLARKQFEPARIHTQDTPAAALFHMHIIFGKKPVLGFVLSQRERFLILEFRHRHAIFNSDGHGTAAQEKIILTPSLPVSNVFAYLWNTVGKDRKLAAISGYATLLK